MTGTFHHIQKNLEESVFKDINPQQRDQYIRPSYKWVTLVRPSSGQVFIG